MKPLFTPLFILSFTLFTLPAQAQLSGAAVADSLEGNIGAEGAMVFGSSVFICVPTVLAESDEALGAAGLPLGRMRDLATAAGFSYVGLVSLDGGSFFEMRP